MLSLLQCPAGQKWKVHDISVSEEAKVHIWQDERKREPSSVKSTFQKRKMCFSSLTFFKMLMTYVE
jgi:hypothetical protein